jgi:hypothetical protein
VSPKPPDTAVSSVDANTSNEAVGTGGTPAADGGTTAGPPTADTGESTSVVSSSATSHRPALFSVSAHAGLAFLGLGPDPAVDVPAQFSIAVGGGYPLPVGPVTLIAGALIAYTPVSWENADTDDDGSSGLTSLLANGTVDYPLMDSRLSMLVSLGLGVQILSGVDQEGNVFIEEGMVATGALTMFNLRVSGGAGYAITDNIVVGAHAGFAYSPAKEGMRESIDALTRLEILAGVGYQM